jgi:hypothetical protein
VTPAERRALRAALLEVAPWLARNDVGPQSVDAGLCDRCGLDPRLLPTCGPSGGGGVCRDCAEVLGDDGWCDGHRDEGRQARGWAAALPDRWPDLVVLWWTATGEARLDRVVVDRTGLPPAVSAVLPG